ncbi:hypothetical protein CVU82_00500 [Candidatus Falkowbacteria bacterium HGW-Falkowbacteria-1]|uniref:Glycosyltransferase 2-like domain-containing protein n=1 Tax=Candidatus Falkowbacteria bacterium HGW-Falkowbacteria-1 TaxID=2013768 RepID=A0A2N2EAC2_9BACT|nr:MAG: hypothetical protein CVU82_00500 [Candidatus Falkowbacteria bacterium HGW-Falkowbacteria-1]
MDLSVVIVNYKSKEKTKVCLESILKSDLKGLDFEVILVENASGDRFDDLSFDFNNFKLIESDKNLGMGGGNNLGINKATGDFVLILNPDTELKPGAIRIMFDYIKGSSETYIVGPKLLNSDMSLQYSCAYFPRPWTPIFRRTFLGRFFKKHLDWFLMKNFSHDSIKEVDWLMGSCLMIRKDGFDGFDKRFFMYFEDIDVCRRSWYHGKKVVYHPGAEVIHHHARESAGGPWYLAVFKNKLTREHIKSWYKYFKKWGLGRK